MAAGELYFKVEIPGQLSEKEAHAIAIVAAHLPNGSSMVEVGSLFGRSAWIWAKNAPANVAIYCIDPWESDPGIARLEQQFKVRFGLDTFIKFTAGLEAIKPMKGYSPDDFSDWKTPIFLYFEDSVHKNPVFTRNLAFWTPHVVSNGILCGHDYVLKFPDVRQGVCKLAQSLNKDVLLIDSFWCIQKAPCASLTEELLALGAVTLNIKSELKSATGFTDLPIDAQDVIDAYRFYLGRLPESEKAISGHISSCRTFGDLRKRIMSSPEFQAGCNAALPADGMQGRPPCGPTGSRR